MKVLWVEDHIEGFRELVSRLQSRGIEPEFAQTESDFRKINLDDYDYYIVDNKIGNSSRFGQSIINSLLNSKDKRALFHTAYLPPHAKSKTVIVDKKRNNVIGYLEKDLPDFDRVNEFWDGLCQKIDNFFKQDDPANSLEQIEISNNDYERISRLSLNDFEYELKAAAKKNTHTITTAFEKGAAVVIIPSDETRDIEIHYGDEHLPNTTELVSRYSKEGIFPFMFRSDYRFDDLDCHSSNRKDRVRDYPHAVLAFGDDEFPIHFDTGADTSIFSEAFVNEVGNAKVVNPIPFGFWIQRTEHIAKEISLTSVIKNPDRAQDLKGPGHSVEVPGLMVTSWSSSDLQIRCSTDCKKPTKERDLCIYRANGLLGRDLYVSNQLRVTLSPSDTRIEVAEDD